MLHGQAGRAPVARLHALLFGLAALTLAGSGCTPKGGFDAGSADTGVDAGRDAGHDAGVDAGEDAGHDAGVDAGEDAGVDAGTDAGVDAGEDAGPDSGTDSGFDAGPIDSGPEDAGVDAGPVDAGPMCRDFTEMPPTTTFASNAGLGQPCDLTIGTNQANCKTGLSCQVMAPGSVAFCATGCNSGFDCAPGGGGVCVSGSPNLCLATCDSTHACPQNLVCDHNVCIPDCRYQPSLYCTVQWGAHTMCSQATGTCEQTNCATNNNCPNGGTCDTTVTPHACIYDCNVPDNDNFCCHLGADRMCLASGLCDLTGGYPTGLALVLPQFDAGMPDADILVNPCNGDGDCPADSGYVDAGTDAGNCSPYDGGPVDGGSPPVNGSLGAACGPASPLGESTQQGSCAAGETCATLDIAGLCTKSCAVDGDCGMNGGALQNKCVVSTAPAFSACFVSCDASHGCLQGMACDQTDYLGGASVCLPDCRREWPTYCNERVQPSTTCDQGTGVCKKITCPATACPSGTICDMSQGACQIDCRTQPGNFCCAYTGNRPFCNTSSGACIE